MLPILNHPVQDNETLFLFKHLIITKKHIRMFNRLSHNIESLSIVDHDLSTALLVFVM